QTVAFTDTVAPAIDEFTVVAKSDGTATITCLVYSRDAIVTVEGPAGPITLTQNADGSYSADVPAPVVDGDYTATATDGTNSTDQIGRASGREGVSIAEVTVVAKSKGTETITLRVEVQNANVS